MTCIAAVVDSTSCAIAGDSAIDCGGEIWTSSAPKIASRGAWLVGAAGDAAACSSLLITLVLPQPPRSKRGAMSWGAERIPEIVGDVSGDWLALLCMRGIVWYVDSSGAVEPVAAGYHAIGSGGAYALGSLHTTADGSLSASERAVAAVESAVAYRGDCGLPVRCLRRRLR